MLVYQKNHVGVDTYKLKHYLGFESLQKERNHKDISISPLVYVRMQNFKQCIYSILTLSSLYVMVTGLSGVQFGL